MPSWRLSGQDYPDVTYMPTVFTSYGGYAPAGSLTLTDEAGEYGIVRWTAPTTGQYAITGSFTGVYPGTTMDVHLIAAGAHELDGEITGQGSQPFSAIVGLVGGQTVEFRAGQGPDDASFDRAILDAQITAVPEPGTWLGGCLGLSATLWFFGRKQV